MSFAGKRGKLLIAGGAAAIAIAVALVLLVGDGEDEESLESALAYVPADAATVVAVETDLGDEQWEAFAQTGGRELLADAGLGRPGGEPPLVPLGPAVGEVERRVSAILLSQGIEYRSQVKPLLGGELVVASAAPPDDLADPPPSMFVLDTGNGGAAERLLRDVIEFDPVGEYEGARLFGTDSVDGGQAEVALDGDVLVYAADDRPEDDRGLRAAIDRARAGEGLPPERLEEALSGVAEDALGRAFVDPAPFLALPELTALGQLPWVAALESIGASASFEESEGRFELVANTDAAGITEGDLPFPPDAGEPALVRRDREVSSASVDQSYTTAFLVRAARAVFADSDFVREVRRIERDLGIDFEQEVLRQFAGPSASAVAPGGDFAARSTVADPAAMRALLPRLAPRLPQLVRDLDSLGTEGLLALLFIAPDAPVASVPLGAASVAEAAAAQGEPESAPAAADEQLYVIRGPRGPRGLDPVVALPDRIVFGMIGDTFVVASDFGRAREIAAAESAPEEGLEGASVLLADDGRALPRDIGDLLGLDFSGIAAVRAFVDASLDRVRAELTAEYD